MIPSNCTTTGICAHWGFFRKLFGLAANGQENEQGFSSGRTVSFIHIHYRITAPIAGRNGKKHFPAEKIYAGRRL